MKSSPRLMILAAAAGLLAELGCLTAGAASLETEALSPSGIIGLDDVHGRIDHFAYDAAGQRLFMAALGNDTVEVVDVAANKRLHSIEGEREPQGIRYLAQQKTVVVATGEGGTVDFFDGHTFKLKKRVAGYDDADNIRIDPKDNRPVVGWGSGALTWFSDAGAVIATTKLPAHPESFQFSPSRRRIYVNVPFAGKVCVVDADSRKLIASWNVPKAASNYSMAVDDDAGFVFIACRHPACIIALDMEHGHEVSRIATSGDADDLYYDPVTRRMYESCGEGFLDVFDHDGKGSLKRVSRVATALGARTSIYVPELHKLFLAVPRRGNQRCEIRIFKTT